MTTNMDRPADIAGALDSLWSPPYSPSWLAILTVRLCRCRRTLLEAVAGSNIAALPLRGACGPRRNQEIPWPAVTGIRHAKVKFCTCMEPGILNAIQLNRLSAARPCCLGGPGQWHRPIVLVLLRAGLGWPGGRSQSDESAVIAPMDGPDGSFQCDQSIDNTRIGQERRLFSLVSLPPGFADIVESLSLVYLIARTDRLQDLRGRLWIKFATFIQYRKHFLPVSGLLRGRGATDTDHARKSSVVLTLLCYQIASLSTHFSLFYSILVAVVRIMIPTL